MNEPDIKIYWHYMWNHPKKFLCFKASFNFNQTPQNLISSLHHPSKWSLQICADLTMHFTNSICSNTRKNLWKLLKTRSNKPNLNNQVSIVHKYKKMSKYEYNKKKYPNVECAIGDKTLKLLLFFNSNKKRKKKFLYTHKV